MVFTIGDVEAEVSLIIVIPGTSSPTVKPRSEVLLLNITLQKLKGPPVIEQVIVLSVLMAMYKGPVGVTVTTAIILIINTINNYYIPSRKKDNIYIIN